MSALLKKPVFILSLAVTAALTSVGGQISPSSVFLPPSSAHGTVSQQANSTAGFNPQYSILLGDALWFYEAQRSGALPSDNRVPWRNSSCEDDGSMNSTDLSGGYFDAGDYIKATYPLCWTMTSLAWSALSFGSGYARSAQDAYLDSTLRWGLDFLSKAHSDPNTLWVLVSNPTIDDDYWGGDQNIPTPRPAFSVTRNNPGTDAFASCAAAFAASAYLYSDSNASLPISTAGLSLGGVPSLHNQSYSEGLLRHAEGLWDLATTSMPMQVYQVASPQAGQSYPSSDYQDDLFLASLFLALATNNKTYIDTSLQYYTNTTRVASANNAALNWDRKAPALPILATQIAKYNASMGLDPARFSTDAEAWLDKLVNGNMDSVSETKDGLLYWAGDSDSASLNPALNAAFMADIYSGFASTPAKTSSYLSLAKKQVDYLLGANNYNGPYVVGLHPNSPQNPHSAAASGGSDMNNINTSPPSEAHVLYGAVVGGPDKEGRFFDLRDDYPETEVALDYNAPLVAAALSRIARNFTDDPVYVTLSGTANVASGQPQDAAYPGTNKAGLSKGAQIAIAVVVVVVVLSLVGVLAWWKRERIRQYYRQKKIGL